MASNLKVIINNPQTTIKIPSGTRMLVRRSCHAALEYEQYDHRADIYVDFVDNEMLNKFKSKRVSTIEAPEVIADPSDQEECLGTLYISVERVIELTKVYNRPFEMGIVYAAVHGVLNLLGQYYTDKPAKDDQMLKEAKILTQLGFSPIVGF
ncbi:rRNA maturation RNAse YbeY [Ruminococcus difficilis]|uniref:rRNA maturation RNAse YbeY n=1 Tax=Ruminococcus difficilis TaxID=2763069 RepID=A0A934WUC3_9FIRM|nr:rRNA maturation RNAse YbeY [Ruminococcus difficilis]MBK6090128.1 rRNA maturation RNAse YbeY [Ruminococcus difficilis]